MTFLYLSEHLEHVNANMVSCLVKFVKFSYVHVQCFLCLSTSCFILYSLPSHVTGLIVFPWFLIVSTCSPLPLCLNSLHLPLSLSVCLVLSKLNVCQAWPSSLKEFLSFELMNYYRHPPRERLLLFWKINTLYWIVSSPELCNWIHLDCVSGRDTQVF